MSRFFGRRKQQLQIDSSTEGIKLNVGGGKGHPHVSGWLIADLRDTADIKLDISKEKLPFEDNSVAVIFTSHVLEHILPHHLGFVLDEFQRVLKPFPQGGLLRIAVPDIELACRAYVANDRSFFERSDLTYFDKDAPIGGLFMSWAYSVSSIGNGHCHCFDFDYMAYWLRKHRFRNIVRSAYRRSQLPELRSEAFDRHPLISLYVEATK